MSPLYRGLLAGFVCLGLCYSLTPARAGLVEPKEHNRLLEQLPDRPIIFFVAKGPADSCGTGCSEWIAAVGTFDVDGAKRFREFLAAGKGRERLPIFFHSRGGLARSAVEIGLVLRERQMTAGVGRTITDECRLSKRDDTRCAQQNQSVKARLAPREGQCHSACGLAFAGASVRHVARGALFGIHAAQVLENAKYVGVQKPRAAKQAPPPESRQITKRYLHEMGIDPGLEDLASKTNAKRLYVLSRDEIARYGVETTEFYETPWRYYKPPSGQQFVMKSITQSNLVKKADYVTTTFRLTCSVLNPSLYLLYRRGVADDTRSIMEMAAGQSEIVFQTQTVDLTEVGVGTIKMNSAAKAGLQDIMVKAAASQDLKLIEKVMQEGTASARREIKLSTAGLMEALAEVEKSCGPKLLNIPNIWGAR